MFLFNEYTALLWGTACQVPSQKFSPTSPLSETCMLESFNFHIHNLYMLQLDKLMLVFRPYLHHVTKKSKLVHN